MKSVFAFLSLLLSCAQLHAQQQCNDRINHSTPTSRFADNGDGTTTDSRTGLMWQRCAVGFVFSDRETPTVSTDDICASIPDVETLFTWRQALQDVVTSNAQGGFAGFSDWRLPNAKELISIVETRCAGPALNQEVFPGNVSLEEFFTSSPANVGTADTAVVTVDFAADGADTYTVLSASPSPVKYVRRVRVAN